MIRPLATLSLLLLATSGCIAPLPDPSVETPAGALAERLAQATRDEWWILNATAGPEARLTAFWWTVPEGAVYPDSGWGRYTTTVLEIAPLDEDAGVTEWALFAFRVEEGELSLVASDVWTPFAGAHGTLLDEEKFEKEVDPRPFFFHLGFDKVRVGDAVGFVVVARAPAEIPYALALRVMPEDPYASRSVRPAHDAADFVAKRQGRPPLDLPATGAGAGFQEAFYLESNSFFVTPSTWRFWTPAVRVTGEVSPDLRPVAAERDQTYSASHPGGGWSRGGGFFWAHDAVGEWRVQAEVHGETIDAGGPVVTSAALSPVSPVDWLLFGFPGYWFTQEGDGASASAFRVQTTQSSAAGWDFLLFEQMDLGATLEDLLGYPARQTAAWSEGIVGQTRLRPLPDGGIAYVLPDGSAHARHPLPAKAT